MHHEGRRWLIVQLDQYGKTTNRARLQEVPTTAKKLQFPNFYPPEKVDFTYGLPELDFGTKLRHREKEIQQIAVLNKRIKFNLIPEEEEPWEYQYERDEPYTVRFGRSQVFVYVHKETSTEPTGLFDNWEIPVASVPLKSCLKKNIKYKVSNNTYSGYWYGILFPKYIRGQVRRQREKEEREAVKRRQATFRFLENFWVPSNTRKRAKIEEIEEEINKIDCLGHLSEQELVQLKKKVKIEEE
jgi:hypothetical protein